MKLYGYLKGTGKLGNIVCSQVGGETIARDYNPNVSNPNTDGQVSQRSRFKLASQIAAALAQVIVIPKKGLQSARNLFVKKNMPYFYGTPEGAQVSYENLQLTNGNSGLPGIALSRGASNVLNVSLNATAAASVSRVVYCAFRKTSEDILSLIGSVVVETAGADGKFAGTIANVVGEVVVYAYGMRDANAAATAAYGSYQVLSGEDIAELFASRKLNMSGYTFTMTRGVTLKAGEDSTIEVGENQSLVFLTIQGGGTLTGININEYPKAVNNGTALTATAVPNEGYKFDGWFYNGQQTAFQTGVQLSLTVNNQLDIIARFSEDRIGPLE